MRIDVVPPERLLHHEQIEFVKSLQMLRILERVGGICVDGESNLGERLADGANEFQVLARFDFQFDALIARGDLHGDFFTKHVGTCLQSDRNTTRDFISGAAKKFCEGNFLLLRFNVPKSIFQSGARHFMPADLAERRRHV